MPSIIDRVTGGHIRFGGRPTGGHIRFGGRPTGGHIGPGGRPTGGHIGPGGRPTGGHIRFGGRPTGGHIGPGFTEDINQQIVRDREQARTGGHIGPGRRPGLAGDTGGPIGPGGRPTQEGMLEQARIVTPSAPESEAPTPSRTGRLLDLATGFITGEQDLGFEEAEKDIEDIGKAQIAQAQDVFSAVTAGNIENAMQLAGLQGLAGSGIENALVMTAMSQGEAGLRDMIAKTQQNVLAERAGIRLSAAQSRAAMIPGLITAAQNERMLEDDNVKDSINMAMAIMENNFGRDQFVAEMTKAFPDSNPASWVSKYDEYQQAVNADFPEVRSVFDPIAQPFIDNGTISEEDYKGWLGDYAQWDAFGQKGNLPQPPWMSDEEFERYATSDDLGDGVTDDDDDDDDGTGPAFEAFTTQELRDRVLEAVPDDPSVAPNLWGLGTSAEEAIKRGEVSSDSDDATALKEYYVRAISQYGGFGTNKKITGKDGETLTLDADTAVTEGGKNIIHNYYDEDGNLVKSFPSKARVNYPIGSIFKQDTGRVVGEIQISPEELEFLRNFVGV